MPKKLQTKTGEERERRQRLVKAFELSNYGLTTKLKLLKTNINNKSS